MSAVESGSGEAGAASTAAQEGVRVTRTVQAPVAEVWRVLTGPGGAEALLGAGAAFGGKGEPWRCADGASGVLRSFHPLEQLRWSFHETPEAPATIVELDLVDEGGTTRLDLRHDGVTDAATYEARWSDALDRVGALTTEAISA